MLTRNFTYAVERKGVWSMLALQFLVFWKQLEKCLYNTLTIPYHKTGGFEHIQIFFAKAYGAHFEFKYPSSCPHARKVGNP
jgi:hypothetical protein